MDLPSMHQKDVKRQRHAFKTPKRADKASLPSKCIESTRAIAFPDLNKHKFEKREGRRMAGPSPTNTH